MPHQILVIPSETGNGEASFVLPFGVELKEALVEMISTRGGRVGVETRPCPVNMGMYDSSKLGKFKCEGEILKVVDAPWSDLPSAAQVGDEKRVDILIDGITGKLTFQWRPRLGAVYRSAPFGLADL